MITRFITWGMTGWVLLSVGRVYAQPSAVYAPVEEYVHPSWYATPLASPDPWLAQDKLQHVTFSFLWTLSTQYVLTNKVGWSDNAALPASVGVGVTVGLSKEVFDWRLGPSRRFSHRDLIADGAGILLAVGVILL